MAIESQLPRRGQFHQHPVWKELLELIEPEVTWQREAEGGRGNVVNIMEPYPMA
ncbi:hypothetical protein HFO92_13045 [Rhizobium leguminosarum]|nr:hypothetical protein [Rhizobium leguminosarum]